MEISKEFIHKFVTETKADKDRLKKEFDSKLDVLACTMNTNLSILEQTFRSNFPHMPVLAFIQSGNITGFVNNTDYATESSYILKGEDEISKEFKRHLEFLKIVSGTTKQAFKLDQLFNHHFKYWNEDYYQSEYVYPNVTEEAKTQYPNIYRALDCFGSVIGYKEKESLNIQNSDKYEWFHNAPVTFKYINNSNAYEIKLSNGLEFLTTSYNIQHCEDLDTNIYKVINTEFIDKFGFDYNNFIAVNEQFNDFIIKLIRLLIIDNKDLYNKTKVKHSYGCVDLVYSNDLRISVSDHKVNILFRFPDSNGNHTNSNKYLEIKIDDPYGNLNEINVKFNMTQQSTRFGIEKYDTVSDDQITFHGYQKSGNATEHYLSYFTEEYKLCVLYYGQKLINDQELIFGGIAQAIADKIKAKEQTEGN